MAKKNTVPLVNLEEYTSESQDENKQKNETDPNHETKRVDNVSFNIPVHALSSYERLVDTLVANSVHEAKENDTISISQQNHIYAEDMKGAN